MKNIKIQEEDLFDSLTGVVPDGVDVYYDKESERLVFCKSNDKRIHRSYPNEEIINLFSSWCLIHKGALEPYDESDFVEFLESLMMKFKRDNCVE